MAFREPTRQSVTRAMREFERVGSDTFLSVYSASRPPRGHYIEHEGKRYPLKALWAAANDPPIFTREFQTAEARRGFIEIGFSPVYIQPAKEPSLNSRVNGERSERLERLAKAEKIPSFRTVSVREFNRNPDVVAEALYIANGFCGSCGAEAPFIRSTNNEPYLEVHHKVPLAQGGEDTVKNAIAICPNCHRRAHFG